MRVDSASTVGTGFGQGVRNLSNYKAELVRHNIVTRTDLMKLYHPPLKKSQMPHKDPFLTRQIVPRPESMNDLAMAATTEGRTSIRSKSNYAGSNFSRGASDQAYRTVTGAFPRLNNGRTGNTVETKLANHMYSSLD